MALARPETTCYGFIKMKISDPEVLRELYDTEADWKLLIGHRFKGALDRAGKTNGRPRLSKRKKRPSRKGHKSAAAAA